MNYTVPKVNIAKPRRFKDMFGNRINIVVPVMQQKHVITHLDQAGRTRSYP